MRRFVSLPESVFQDKDRIRDVDALVIVRIGGVGAAQRGAAEHVGENSHRIADLDAAVEVGVAAKELRPRWQDEKGQ